MTAIVHARRSVIVPFPPDGRVEHLFRVRKIDTPFRKHNRGPLLCFSIHYGWALPGQAAQYGGVVGFSPDETTARAEAARLHASWNGAQARVAQVVHTAIETATAAQTHSQGAPQWPPAAS